MCQQVDKELQRQIEQSLKEKEEGKVRPLDEVLDEIERENPEYQKMLKEALEDKETIPIGDIDEYIKSLQEDI